MKAMLSLRRTRKTSKGRAARNRTTVDAARATATLIDSVYSGSRSGSGIRDPGCRAGIARRVKESGPPSWRCSRIKTVSYEDVRRGGRPDADGRRERVCAGACRVSTELPRTRTPLDAGRRHARRPAGDPARAPHEPRV